MTMSGAEYSPSVALALAEKIKNERIPERFQEGVHVLPQTPQLQAIMTKIRDQNTKRKDFVFFSDRIIRLLVEEGLNLLPLDALRVKTPTSSAFDGVAFCGHICGVPIIRAGEAMEKALRECCSGVRIGKILIQRNDTTHQAELFYKKLPADIAKRYVLLLDPMLATGGSAITAIQVLRDAGVAEDHILFINLVAVAEGVKNVLEAYPKVRIITACVDPGLDSNKYIVPGLGDFGCRYFGTDN